MNKINTNILNDLKNLLEDYMPDANAEDFINGIDDENFSTRTIRKEMSDTDKSQVDYDLPKGTDYRLLIDRMITQSKKLLPEDKYYNLIIDFSQLMLFAGETAYSLEIIQELHSELESRNRFKSILAEAKLMLSKIYWSQAEWDECEMYVSEAKRIFSIISSDSGLGKCENVLGTLYGEKGEFEKARDHFKNALTLLKDTDDLSSIAMILTNLGIINTINGEYETAAWDYKNAIEKFLKLKDVRRLSRVYHNLGMLYTQMEDYDTALEEFNNCITISTENNYLSNCAVSYIGKSFIYTKLNNPGLADAYTDKAMEIACKINDTLSIADIYKIKGMIQKEMSNFQLSEEFFENSIRLNKDFESKFNEAETTAELKKLLQKSNKVD